MFWKVSTVLLTVYTVCSAERQ